MDEDMHIPGAGEDVGMYSTSRPVAASRRAGTRYKAYTAEDFQKAMRAVKEEGMSLRKASVTYNVPKTTLAEKLGDSCPNLPPLQSTRKNKIATRYTWTETDMEQAIAAVQAGVHASEAAKQFGVPYSNLNSRARGRQPRDLKADLARLTLKEENLMVDWAHALCELGFPPTKDQIYELAERVLKRSGPEKSLGKQWVGHWLRRHPHITALDWTPKPKWERKMPRPYINGSFTSDNSAIMDESLNHDPSLVIDNTMPGEVVDEVNDTHIVPDEHSLGEVTSLVIET